MPVVPIRAGVGDGDDGLSVDRDEHAGVRVKEHHRDVPAMRCREGLLSEGLELGVKTPASGDDASRVHEAE